VCSFFGFASGGNYSKDTSTYLTLKETAIARSHGT